MGETVRYVLGEGSGKTQILDLPTDATLRLTHIPLGEKGSVVPILEVQQGTSTIAAFIGIVSFYPESLQPVPRLWAT